MGLKELFGGGKSIGDLTAVQKLIDHANESTQSGFSKVKTLRLAATAEREQMDDVLKSIRHHMEPLCTNYADTRFSIYKPQNGRPALMDSNLVAQGNANNMLWLGAKAKGCIDTCKLPGIKNAPQTCGRGGCMGTLKSTRELEGLIGGLEWKRRDEEVKDACGQLDYKLQVPPPAGFTPDMLEDDPDGDLDEPPEKPDERDDPTTAVAPKEGQEGHEGAVHSAIPGAAVFALAVGGRLLTAPQTQPMPQVAVLQRTRAGTFL